MKQSFKKKLVMPKQKFENFKNSTRCWIRGNDCNYTNVKVRDHCHVTRKYRGSAHRDCNINLKLNRKISITYFTT